MTHEELLITINRYATVYADDVASTEKWEELAKLANAVQSVVELHKPSNKHEVRSKCAGCYIPIPCPTIQAIEKELA